MKKTGNYCEKGIRGRFVIKYREQDLIGKTFNRLTVIKEIDKNKHNQRRVLCRCKCGKETVVIVQQLVNSVVKSCGCLQREKVVTHGLTKNYKRLMNIRHNMIDRCYNSKCKEYCYYGERGVKVCAEWLNDAVAFIEWAKKQEHWNDENYSIDRMDVNGDYSPDNCRWANDHIQNANKRKLKSNNSGYTGVNYRKSENRWRSSITFNKKLIWIKSSKSKKECLDARNDYIIKNNLTEYPIQEWRDDE